METVIFHIMILQVMFEGLFKRCFPTNRRIFPMLMEL